MGRKQIAEGGIFILKSEADETDYVTNLDGVVAATDGDEVNVKGFGTVDVNINVSGNTGAVTVNIETSPTGDFSGEEQNLDSNTYTAENTNDVFSYKIASNYIRTTTTTQSSSTVSTLLSGRS